MIILVLSYSCNIYKLNPLFYSAYRSIGCYSAGVASQTFVESLSSTQCQIAASAYGLSCYTNPSGGGTSYEVWSSGSTKMTIDLCLQICSTYGGFTYGALFV